MDVENIVLKFIEQINAHNVDDACRLMSDDAKFIDALGSIIQGREKLHQAWTGYFRLVPDYYIVVEEIIVSDKVAAIFGKAGGTYAPNRNLLSTNRWQIPAAWRAVIGDQQITEWRVYADNEPLRKLMAETHPKDLP